MITSDLTSQKLAYSSKEQILKTLSNSLAWIDDMEVVIAEAKEKIGLPYADLSDPESPTSEAYNELEKIYHDIKYRGADPDRNHIRMTIKHHFKLISCHIWDLEDQAAAVN